MPGPVFIRTYASRLEAEIAKGVLEAHGIEAFVSADDMSGTRPELTFVLGARLLVKERDADMAVEALDAGDDAVDDPADEPC